MGITNTISRAGLAAIAGAVTQGYSQIATDSLTSLHQKKSSYHTRISIATTSKEMSFNPLLKQSANHRRPSTSSK